VIETQQMISIDAAIDQVWGYVNDIRQWASLVPGCRDCAVINAQDSRWTLKVGVGGLVRTVNVMVHVDAWDAPQQVQFSYRLEGDPVVGSGSYVASRRAAQATDVTLMVRVEGSGPMSPLWEAMSRPLLPQLAKSFIVQLKTEIEKAAHARAAQDGPVTDGRSGLRLLGRRLRELWRTLFGCA